MELSNYHDRLHSHSKLYKLKEKNEVHNKYNMQ